MFDIKAQNIEDVVKETVTAIGPFADQYNVSIVADILTKSPDAMVDSDRLTQLLNNSIFSAIKFSPEGGTVEISAGKNDTFVRVSVVDHDSGIPEEIHPSQQCHHTVNRRNRFRA